MVISVVSYKSWLAGLKLTPPQTSTEPKLQIENLLQWTVIRKVYLSGNEQRLPTLDFFLFSTEYYNAVEH